MIKRGRQKGRKCIFLYILQLIKFCIFYIFPIIELKHTKLQKQSERLNVEKRLNIYHLLMINSIRTKKYLNKGEWGEYIFQMKYTPLALLDFRLAL